ncbi:sugar ABC transporter permease [Thermosipho ferrireducens]|uniref:Sugar ABC transporter permease n=1 Tax=Thermosipho ferrireducens TaxID=2571116 RepID=A0ABX7S647_9BACT|nr:sugar ABC transporter permease [Thermosipho ferrireducens]QTA37220.1 sugar ABC transporter permease [Thermosipho ferrireducens]
MKWRTKEALYGYIFSLPMILVFLIFLIYPIIMSVYYSFTNYQPLEAQKFNYTFDPKEAIEFHTGYFIEDAPSLEELKSVFDPVSFVEVDVGVNLDENQKEAIRKYFNVDLLLKDFIENKLDIEIKISDFMKRYMSKESSLFSKYIPDFVGVNNFKRLLKDDLFWTSLWNTILYTIIVVPVQTLLAVILAVAANLKIRGVNFYKLVFFIPSITSSAAISMIFLLIYSKPGILNRLLVTLSGGRFVPIDWLNEPKVALFAIMMMNIWTTAGYFMVTFLAGLQDIPSSIYEAARIDGANAWNTFWKITFPLLRPQILFVSIMGTIGCMQVFDQIYFLIKNLRNITISFYIYKNAFEYGRMGYASALAFVLFGIILLITMVQRKVVKEEY